MVKPGEVEEFLSSLPVNRLTGVGVKTESDVEKLRNKLLKASEELRLARPTGRNLGWAIERCLRKLEEAKTVKDLKKRLLEEAGRITDEDVEANLRIARNGLELVRDGDSILTHCNTGGLGTVEYGTALGIIRLAWEKGRRISGFNPSSSKTSLQSLKANATPSKTALTIWDLSCTRLSPKKTPLAADYCEESSRQLDRGGKPSRLSKVAL